MVYSWKYLKEVIKNNELSKSAALQRQTAIQTMYNAHLQVVDAKYASRGDFIKISSLGWKPFMDSNGKVIAVKTSSSKSILLEQNAFYYNVRKGVLHYVLWSEKPLSDAEIDEYLHNCGKTKNKILWYVNSKNDQSVHDLWHAQVFFKF